MPVVLLSWRKFILLSILLGLCLTGCDRLPLASPAPTWTLAPAAALPSSTPQALPAPPTPAPTATLTPSLPSAKPARALLATHTPTACLDRMDIVLEQGLAESDLAALQSLPAGAPGSAAWRVRNSGSCTWDSSYALIALDDQAPQFLPRTVKPGDLLDLSVTFSIPFKPGMHTLFWELRDGRGRRVGNPLAVNLLAVDAPVPTLPPGLTLRAYPQVVQPDERTTVSWNVEGAREVYFYQPGQDWRTHPVEASGSVIDFPARDTSYELRVVRGDDSVEIHRVKVEVAPYAPPAIIFLRPQRPDSDATPDECVELEWLVRGRVNTVVLSRDVANSGTGDEKLILSGGRDLASGVVRDCPPSGLVHVYTLWVYGPGGECEASYIYNP